MDACIQVKCEILVRNAAPWYVNINAIATIDDIVWDGIHVMYGIFHTFLIAFKYLTVHAGDIYVIGVDIIANNVGEISNGAKCNSVGADTTAQV